ncbi:MAG: hypothetical protein L0227_09800 [Chloroflexi bacterium]|nr:hypothetical protein [Chloroflexota bacterium]
MTSAPADLARRGPGRRLWRAIAAKYDPDLLETTVLAEACRTLDRLAELRELLERDGLVVAGSKGQSRLHPAIAEERAARLALARLLGMLRLPGDAAAFDGQLASPRSAAASRAARTRWRVYDGTG